MPLNSSVRHCWLYFSCFSYFFSATIGNFALADPAKAVAVPSAVVSIPDKAVETKAPSGVIERLATGQPQDLIVLFDDTQIQNQVSNLRQQAALSHDSSNILSFKATQYTNLKQEVLSIRSTNEVEVMRDYSHLPMAVVRFRSQAALTSFLHRSEVVRVYPDEKRERLLSQSLPIINQPAVASAGKRGSGTTVAVIDSGVDYTRSAFGCTSPGQSAGCKVVYAQDFGHNDGSSGDSDQHGTNVAGIVVGVAPDTKIAALDVFPDGQSASDSAILAAINWSIQNKATYNIVAMNLSLGGSVKNTSICSSSSYATPFANARAAGIVPVVAAGNEGYTNGLSSPACAPGAVSVGAVYDANLGGINAGSCVDSTTAADKVTCFSNSANFLTLLAPGAIITAAGVSQGGTSQATPHVAGAVAVLRASNAFPADTVAQTIARMTSTGTPISDPKSGIVKPRLNLLAATSGTSNQPPSGLAPRADFNNDGKTDILWRRDNGSLVVWLMNGTTLINGLELSPNLVSDTAWKIVGTGDFNNDGKTDILWRRDNGSLVVWLMNGTTLINSIELSPNQLTDTAWKVVGTGDFNNDGKIDILWRRDNGYLMAWLMNGTTLINAIELTPNQVSDTAWKIVGPR